MASVARRVLLSWMMILALIAAGCGGKAPPASSPASAPAKPPAKMQKVKVILSVDIIGFAPIHLAKAKGFFAEEGLEVETVVSQGGTIALSALGGESVEFGALGPTHIIKAAAGGVPLVAVQTHVLGISFNFAMSKKTAEANGLKADAPPIERIRALKGLKVGITRPGAISDSVLRYLLKKAGVDPKDVNIVAVGAGNAMIAGLQNGQIDAFLLGDPAPTQAVKMGIAIPWLWESKGDFKGIFPDAISEVIGVHKDFAAKEPETVKKMVRAVTKGQQYLMDHPDESLTLLTAVYKEYDPQVLQDSIKNLIPTIQRDGRMSQKLWDETVTMLKESGQLSGDAPNASEGGFWTNQYVSDIKW